MRISDWSSDLCSSDLFVQELTRGTDQLVDRLDHVDGNADCSRLIGDGSRNRLPDPPRGVSAELIPPAILKFIDRLHQADRSEEHTSELQSLMRISYAVFCLKKKHHKTAQND